MLKHAFLIAVGIAALVLNPFFGCDAKEDFSYGADEMRAAIEGTWKVTVPVPGKPAQEIVMSISQAAAPTQQHSRRSGPVADAAACAQRSLVRSAGACVDTSEMPVDVKLLADGAHTTGMFRVMGTRFTAGYLQLEVRGTTLSAEIAATGTVTRSTLGGTDASMVRMATAQR